MLRQLLSVKPPRRPGKFRGILTHLAARMGGISASLALLLAMAMGSAAALFFLFWLAARDDREATLAQGWQMASRGAGLMEEYTVRAVEIGRQATGRAAGLIGSHGLDTFKGANWPELGELAVAAPMIGSIWICDSQGNLAASSPGRDPPGTSFPNPELYALLRGGAPSGILGLTYGRATKAWFFSYNLAVRAGGEFLGAAQARMDAGKFGKFFESLGLGSGARFAIYKRDGTVVLRWPLDGGNSPANEGASPLLRELLPQTGGGQLQDVSDGVRYLTACRTLPSFGIAITASVPLVGVLQPYWQRRIRNWMLLSLAYLAISSFAFAAYRASRREKLEAQERESSEFLLRQSEARYRMLVEQSGDGIFIADAAGRCVDVNPAGCAMLGYTREETLTRSIADMIEPDEVPRLQTGLARFAGGKAVLSEWRFRRKNGSVFIGEVLGRRLPDGGLQGIVRDITERRHAEKQLGRSEARFRATFENAAVGIAHVSPDGSCLLVNRRICEITGYARDEIRTKTFRNITHPGDIEADLAQLRRIRKGEIDSYRLEKRYLHKDGSFIWVRVTVGCVRKADGALGYYIAASKTSENRSGSRRNFD